MSVIMFYTVFTIIKNNKEVYHQCIEQYGH
jgi:hypothetical protein